MKKNVCGFGEAQLALTQPIFAQTDRTTQQIQEFSGSDAIAPCSCLTSIVEALEAFQEFEPEVRAAAIALRAKELGISQMHFYAIALYAGLGGER